MPISRRLIQRANYYQSALLREDGYPMLLVGDRHGDKYTTQLPPPKLLRDSGITKVDLMAEDIEPELSFEETLREMRSRTWGNKNMREYALALQQAGITVSARGINTSVRMS